MVSGVDLSTICSAALAIAWTYRSKQPAQPGGGLGFQEMPLQEVPWRVVMWLKDYTPALSFALVLMAASSYQAFFIECISLGVDTRDGSGWLGNGDLSFSRKTALLTSLAIWRADKMESLFLRMERSFKELKGGNVLAQLKSDPYGYIQPALWGWARRIAHLGVSSLGCVPFLHVAYPLVVLDEFLWWALQELSNKFSRLVLPLPMVFDVIILPMVDMLHLLPVIIRVLMMGLLDYPLYDSAGDYGLLLSISALAWTAHNCHICYRTVMDIPDHWSMLYSANT